MGSLSSEICGNGGGMSTQTKSFDEVLELKRFFSAPPEKVFRAWTEPQLLLAWWKGLTTAEIDLEVGGKYLLGWKDSVSQKEDTTHGKFLEISSPNLLSLILNSSLEETAKYVKNALQETSGLNTIFLLLAIFFHTTLSFDSLSQFLHTFAVTPNALGLSKHPKIRATISSGTSLTDKDDSILEMLLFEFIAPIDI